MRALRLLAAAATTRPSTGGRAATGDRARASRAGGGKGCGGPVATCLPGRRSRCQLSGATGSDEDDGVEGDGSAPSFLCVRRRPSGFRLLTACLRSKRGAGKTGRVRPRAPPARTAVWLGAHSRPVVGVGDGPCLCAECLAAASAQCERWRPRRSLERPPAADNRQRACPWGAGVAIWRSRWRMRPRAPRTQPDGCHRAHGDAADVLGAGDVPGVGTVCAAAARAHCEGWRAPLARRRLRDAAHWQPHGEAVALMWGGGRAT